MKTFKEILRLVEPNERLQSIERLFGEMFVLHRSAMARDGYGGMKLFSPDKLSEEELRKLQPDSQMLLPEKEKWKYFEALEAYNSFFILLHAYTCCLREGYTLFLSYVENTLKEKKNAVSKMKATARKNVLNHINFKIITSIAKRHVDHHPKLDELMRIVADPKNGSHKKIIFVENKVTGEHIYELLVTNGVSAVAILEPAKSKAMKRAYDEALREFTDGKLHVLVMNSLRAVPDGTTLDGQYIVINYSMPKSKKVRTERAGLVEKSKIYPQKVLYVCLDHNLDKKIYMITALNRRKKVKEMPSNQGLLFPEEYGRF